jgi:hypothetical protein
MYSSNKVMYTLNYACLTEEDKLGREYRAGEK